MENISLQAGRNIGNRRVKGTVKWSSPSNIAIIKYWGKHGRQLPRNPSISFTLNNAKTITEISYKSKDTPSDVIQLNFSFEGKNNIAFANKITKFFENILDLLPFLKDLEFDINSENTFPHSAGIASSASAMSAIALCLCDIERSIFSNNQKVISLERVSYIARLGSGSASRSVFPYMSMWGKNELVTKASDLYAISYPKIADVFKTYHDDILIVSKKEKSVSSTAGHALMDNNIYAEPRYQQANDRMQLLLSALASGDETSFGKIAEDEALTLHALMMCSDPSYLLVHPNTISIIEKIRAYRIKSSEKLFFTLDAGPNVHLLYPDTAAKNIKSFIQKELKPLCEDGLIIQDMVGMGPEKIK